jgi:hypothetical protein
LNRKVNEKDPLEVVGCARGHSYEELFNNLPRHQNFSPNLFKIIKKIPEVILRNSGTLVARKVNRMMREVATEAYRAKQFTRTEINNRGVLYGIVLLKHRVMDIVLNYFHQRWPQCIICLYNEYIDITSIIDEKGKIQEFRSPLKEIVLEVSKNRPIIPYFNDIQFTGKQIFETLYKSQNISQRENSNFFKKMIPDKCYDLPGMRNSIERRFRNKEINDFL